MSVDASLPERSCFVCGLSEETASLSGSPEYDFQWLCIRCHNMCRYWEVHEESKTKDYLSYTEEQRQRMEQLTLLRQQHSKKLFG